MPKARRVTVKIISSEDVPAKGEKLAILAKLTTKEEAELIRREFGDEKIIAVWKENKVIRLI